MKYALIPARGGSKGLPKKNIAMLLGKPLIAWTIEAAIESKIFDKIFVSTDCSEIRHVATLYGATVIDRPLELATDHASSHVVIEHAIKVLGLHADDQVMLLQPTSPLRDKRHIAECMDEFTSRNNVRCLISVFEPDHHPAKAFTVTDNGCLKGLYSDESPFKRRQDLPKSVYPNGAIYLFEVKEFLKNHCIPTSDIYPYFMSKKLSVDIDSIDDINEIERYYKT